MRDCKRYPIKNEYQLNKEKEKQQYQKFCDAMKSNGWTHQILLMQHPKWVKGEDILRFKKEEIYWNNDIITNEELYEKLPFLKEVE